MASFMFGQIDKSSWDGDCQMTSSIQSRDREGQKLKIAYTPDSAVMTDDIRLSVVTK